MPGSGFSAILVRGLWKAWGDCIVVSGRKALEKRGYLPENNLIGRYSGEITLIGRELSARGRINTSGCIYPDLAGERKRVDERKARMSSFGKCKKQATAYLWVCPQRNDATEKHDQCSHTDRAQDDRWISYSVSKTVHRLMTAVCIFIIAFSGYLVRNRPGHQVPRIRWFLGVCLLDRPLLPLANTYLSDLLLHPP